MTVTTLTLNPAVDLHCSAPTFRLHHENLAESVTREPGGKGINLSRALMAKPSFSEPVSPETLIVLGSENASEFTAMLDAAGLSFTALTVPGRIRENVTIHPAAEPETRLSFRGFTAPRTLLDDVYEKITHEAGDIVAFTGSLPRGVSSAAAEEFLLRLKADGVKLVIDSKSISLAALERIKPWLIKPNTEELAAYLGGNIPEEELPGAAQKLYALGIENVMLSLGGDGAILACADGLFRAVNPKIDALSTIGAGDSAIGGFIAAYAAGADPSECLRRAVSYGSAACLLEGTKPPRGGDINRIYAEVRVAKL